MDGAVASLEAEGNGRRSGVTRGGGEWTAAADTILEVTS